MSGFGYDAVHNDYKIVTLSYYDTDNEHEPDCDQTFVDVFSVKMKTWQRIENSPYDHAVPNVSSGVFVNGCLHWLASSRTVGYLSVIAAFSLADEEFEEVPPPSSVDVEKFVFNELLVLGGCLAMVVDYFKGSIDVWVMKQYGVQDSWTKFTVNVAAGDSMKPVCLLRDGEVVLEKDGEKLVKYDLAEGISRDMVVVDLADLFEEVVMTFTESLLSPNFDEE